MRLQRRATRRSRSTSILDDAQASVSSGAVRSASAQRVRRRLKRQAQVAASLQGATSIRRPAPTRLSIHATGHVGETTSVRANVCRAIQPSSCATRNDLWLPNAASSGITISATGYHAASRWGQVVDHALGMSGALQQPCIGEATAPRHTTAKVVGVCLAAEGRPGGLCHPLKRSTCNPPIVARTTGDSPHPARAWAATGFRVRGGSACTVASVQSPAERKTSVGSRERCAKSWRTSCPMAKVAT